MTDHGVLELVDVSLHHWQTRQFGLGPITFKLGPGECVLLTVAQAESCSLIGDLAVGLLEPDNGYVRFLDRPWSALDGKALSAHRGRIGRLFAGHAWLSNLDVDENILLAARHHFADSLRSLRRHADALAEQLGLGETPHRRPTQLARHDLKLAQWIRALLGPKTLLVLENPLLDVYPAAIPVLFDKLAEARRQGTALLWLSSELTEYERRQVDPDWQYAVPEAAAEEWS
ncbi:MAG: hypothetical protein H6970_06560 [Gammaproteobacteria bacterium]|nr:hypothetical protein [Gammaproteobacteria bacterium]MCP5424716.1 hypothetical protein [Gammaproteobacteria bacterium]MCP5459249.1 hypothetical protein [Gammaproteobacteria bacterium]